MSLAWKGLEYPVWYLEVHKNTVIGIYPTGKFLLTLYHTLHTFNDPKEEGFGKDWEKEKMLETSIFSFSHSVFYPIEDRNHPFNNIYFVICKCIQFGPRKNFVVWKRVNH